jgi:competence protein ComEC
VPPVLGAALCVVGGDLLGLTSATILWPFAMALATIAAALALHLRDSPTVCVAFCALAGIGAGMALGGQAGDRAKVSCVAELRAGEAMAVVGRLRSRLREAVPEAATGGGPTSRWARVRLEDVTLTHEGRRCRLPHLSARLERPAVGVDAGSWILARGHWRPYGDEGAGAVRPLHSYGRLYGSVVEVAHSAGRPWLASLRTYAASRLDALLPRQTTPVAKALVLAERSELDPRVTRRFADAGLVHLLAISGLHVGLLAAAASFVLGFIVPHTQRYLVAAALLGFYVVLIGAPPSALRAALLFAGYATARARGGPAHVADLLGVAALVAIVLDPLVILRPGFQLSFAGFSGLIAGGHVASAALRDPMVRASMAPTRRRLSRCLRATATAFAASAGAFAFTAPIAAWHFERVAPVAVLSNFAGTPLVALALAGLLSALMLPGPLAHLGADAATTALRLLQEIVDVFASLPLHGSVPPPQPMLWSSVALTIWGLLALTRPGRPRRGLLRVGTGVGLLIVAPVLGTLQRGDWTLLCSLDVGQGDATAIRTRRGHWLLIDAGPGPGFPSSSGSGFGPRFGSGSGSGFEWRYGDAGARKVAPFLRRRGARSVDLFVLSHPHLDHLGGAASLFGRFPVRRVLEPGYQLPSGQYLRFLEQLEETGVEWRPARAGSRLTLDEVELTVLAPGPDLDRSGGAPPGASDANEVSAVVRLQIGAFRYLNTGDAPAATERALLATWPADSLTADVLKVGHHGSRTSSALEWLTAVESELAVISAGPENRYGHPHEVTLARLDSAGVRRVWRTDREGTLCVTVEPDGTWEVIEPEA